MNLITHQLFAVLLLSSFGLAACQRYAPINPLFVAEKVLLDGSPATAMPAAVAPTVTPAAPLADTPAVTPEITPSTEQPAPAAAADYSPTMPVALAIPAVGLRAQVTPMGWEPALIDGQVTTRWVVPEQTLGWAVNSVGAGDPGNVVIAGHQALGAALFRPVSLGEVVVGQEIQVQAADGTNHLYRVTEVSEPITAIGATAGEEAQAAAYLAPAATAHLTLVSGWPADATTHRMFIVAEYVGVQP